MKKKWLKIIVGIVLVLLASAGWLASFVHNEFAKLESDDPVVWESVIREFEQEDKINGSPKKAVVFAGSSSIRFWWTLKEDMAPIPVIRRGFGGAKLRDVIHYTDRIIFPYRPRAVVLFAGTNDITGRPNDKTAWQVARDFSELVVKIQQEMPWVAVYYIPITPSVARPEVWPEANRANRLIRKYAQSSTNVTFIDCTSLFLDDTGKVKDDLIWWDGVHLSKKGYRLWASVIRARLMEDLGYSAHEKETSCSDKGKSVRLDTRSKQSNMNPFPEMTSARLILGQLQARDIPRIIQYAGNRRIADMTLNIPHPYEEKDAIFWINASNQGFANNTQINFRIGLKENNEFMGGVGLRIESQFDRGELGYWIAEPFWNRGFATEAVSMVLKYGFETQELNKIFATHLVDNPASGKVMLKNGMIREADLVEHLKKDGKYFSLVQYRLTKTEYKQRMVTG